ncbi:N-acetylmuramate alpha-1-phosphate uridylyltransferase MurU [Haliea sp. E1-2-M8]|uniref:N-acetylmuramate alpha-1-phosphate uridylyltransferase MurU n=1 Tax=Haliea sp. E1-2-M8 TaxID=3064706 RepID=UPI00351C89BC
MILAAGVGERMRPLTEHTPKPLLEAGGRPLIAWHIEALAALGLRELVINVSHLAGQIMDWCGDGSRWGVRISYSLEPEPLETAGGIHRALPLLGDAPFLVLNGDVWTAFPLQRLLAQRNLAPGSAHLVLVDNPPQHPEGDFCMTAGGSLSARPAGTRGLTYAGIGVYTAGFFADMAPGKLPLRPLLDAAIAAGRVSGEHFGGPWTDVGTPQRLRELDVLLSSSP